MRTAAVLPVLLLLSCAEEPTPEEDEATRAIPAEVTPQKQLEEHARSIEQAAEEAVKLIEEEARDETAATAAEPANQ